MLMNQNLMNINFQLLNQQNLFQNINSVNIYDCFDYNQKIDIFKGENSMYCNTCKKQLSASYKTLLYTTPEILIIVLNRGKGIEFNVKLEFSESLNLMNYVELKEPHSRRGGERSAWQAQALCKEKHTTGLMYAWTDQKVPDLGGLDNERRKTK